MDGPPGPKRRRTEDHPGPPSPVRAVQDWPLTCGFVGAPGRIRTCDTRFRNSIRLRPLTCEDDQEPAVAWAFASRLVPVSSRCFPWSRGLFADLFHRRHPAALQVWSRRSVAPTVPCSRTPNKQTRHRVRQRSSRRGLISLAHRARRLLNSGRWIRDDVATPSPLVGSACSSSREGSPCALDGAHTPLSGRFRKRP